MCFDILNCKKQYAVVKGVDHRSPILIFVQLYIIQKSSDTLLIVAVVTLDANSVIQWSVAGSVVAQSWIQTLTSILADFFSLRAWNMFFMANFSVCRATVACFMNNAGFWFPCVKYLRFLNDPAKSRTNEFVIFSTVRQVNWELCNACCNVIIFFYKKKLKYDMIFFVCNSKFDKTHEVKGSWNI